MATPTASNVIHGNVENSYAGAWHEYLEGLESTLDQVETCLDEARDVQEVCTDEWCEATDRLLDDLHHVIFSIHEPRWASEEDSQKIKQLRKRIRKQYRDYEQLTEA
jgi:DNA-binding ferritin-like protein